jgi:NAD-dependent DNA ligase
MPTLTKEQQKKSKEAAAAKGLTPGMAAINKGQISITSYTTQGVLDKSTPLTTKDKILSIKKTQVMGTALQGQCGDQDKVMEEQNPRSNDENEEDQEMGHMGSPLEGHNLHNTSFTSANVTPQDPVPSTILNNKCVVVSGWFGSPAIREGIKQLIQANGGTMKQSVSKMVNVILVGERPGKNKISAGRRLGTHMVGLPSLHRLLDRESDWELFLREPSLVINEFHEGRQVDRQEEGKDDGNLKDPPEVRRTADKSNTVGTPEGTEEMRNV